MKTSELISNFEYENGNPIVEQTILDNGDTITIVLEGVASKDFPKPNDFEEYIKSLKS